MSEAPETPEVDATADATEAPEIPSVETAFIILKNLDGSWGLLADITKPFSIERAASRSDVRIGTTEINHLLSHQDLAALVAATLKASQENK